MNKKHPTHFIKYLRAMMMILLLLHGAVTATAVTYTALPSAAGTTLENNVVYTVVGSQVITASDSGAGLTVRENATTTIYIPQGCVLTVRGSDAVATQHAYAGIEVPTSATLIITGEGTLVARGGNAAPGGKGGDGGNALLSIAEDWGMPGQGGAGGYGGGGAAAGIGGNGGNGHDAQEGPTRQKLACDIKIFDCGGNNGYGSQDGHGGTGMGKVYVLGTVRVEAYYGSTPTTAAQAGEVGANASDAGSGWGHNYGVGGGGPGGGGGSGFAAVYGIGGGAPGGQCGGTGGSGGTYWRDRSDGYIFPVGGSGAGGSGGVNGMTHVNTRTGKNPIYGGLGGAQQPNAAAAGGHGKLYVASAASLLIDGGRRADYEVVGHYAIAGTVTLDPNGGDLDNNKSATTVYYGVVPEAVTVPTRQGYVCTGYFTAADGGEMVFNASGEASKVCTNLNLGTLYAHWMEAAESNYINTQGVHALELDYAANEHTKTTVHVKINALHTGNNTLFGTAGSRDLSSQDLYGIWVNGKERSFHFATGCGELKSPDGIAECGRDYYITLRLGYIEIDTLANGKGHLYHRSFAVYPFNANTNYLTFGACHMPGVVDANADLWLYDVQISEGETVIFDLVPAYASVEGENGVGMYDKVREATYVSRDKSAFVGEIVPCQKGKHLGFTCSDMNSDQGGTRHCVICGYAERITHDQEPYLSFHGTSYFQTDYVPNYKTVVKMHFIQHENTATNTCQDFFGVRNETEGSRSSFCLLSFDQSVEIASERGGKTRVVRNLPLVGGHEYYLTMSADNVKITTDEAGENVLTDYDYNAPSFTIKNAMTVGAIVYGDSPSKTIGDCLANFDLFSFDIYEGEVLKHSFVPVVWHGHYGFRDTQDGTFCRMLGTGATSNTPLLDENYISTNGTSYLDTQYHPNDKTSIYTRLRYNKGERTICAFGTSGSPLSYDTPDNYYFSFVNEGKAVCFNIAGSRTDYQYPTQEDTDYYIRMSKSDGALIYAEKEWLATDSLNVPAKVYTNSVANAQTLYVGGHHMGTTADLADLKIYAFDIKEGNVYKHHFMPARRGEKLGFYDSVTDDFYPMQGMGASGLINTCAEHKYLGPTVNTVEGVAYRRCLVCDELVPHAPNAITIGGGAKVNVIDLGAIPTLSTDVDIRLHVLTSGTTEGILLTGYGLNDGAMKWGMFNSKERGIGYATSGSAYYDENYALGQGEYILRNVGQAMRTSVVEQGYCASEITLPEAATTRKLAAGGLKLGGYSNASYPCASYKVLALDLYDNKEGELRHHFIPARRGDTYGLLDACLQQFHPVANPQNSLSYVAECAVHPYVEYSQNADGTTQMHCRVCDHTVSMPQEELPEGNFIETNGCTSFDSGYAPTEEARVVVCPAGVEHYTAGGTLRFGTQRLSTERASTIISSVDIYEGDSLARHFIPSTYGGKACMYETLNGKIHAMKPLQEEASGEMLASACVRECSYHRFYTFRTPMKHCLICDKQEQVNVINCSTVQLRGAIPEDGNTLYIDMYDDKDAETKVEQHIDTRYPATDRAYTLFDMAVMRQGQLLHHYLPGKFDGRAGLYDAVGDRFILVPDATVEIVDCQNHRYCKSEMKGGVLSQHCYICDAELPAEYYFEITFEANGGHGEMPKQTLIGSGAINANCFTRELGLFAGWDINHGGRRYDDGAQLKATAADHGEITLYAQWNDACTYNGVLRAISSNKMDNIPLVDDGRNGFATSRGFRATHLSYTRQIENGVRYGTLCLPFGIASSEQVSLYTVTSIDEVISGAEGKEVIHLRRVERIEAGEACIFKLNDGVVADAVTLECAEDSLVMAPVDVPNGEVCLRGCFTGRTFICDDPVTDYYGVMNDHFVHVTSSLTVQPYHAYITRRDADAARREVLYLRFDDGPDGIEAITCDGVSLEGAEFFSLDGRRVAVPRAGSILVVRMKNGEIRKIRF